MLPPATDQDATHKHAKEAYCFETICSFTKETHRLNNCTYFHSHVYYVGAKNTQTISFTVARRFSLKKNNKDAEQPTLL